ncbi:MAG: TRAP transporter large permease subunit [Proteobacteria bacterium]|nr:TRAP transporter large permease subunit [Pseudomonadota bacterium]
MTTLSLMGVTIFAMLGLGLPIAVVLGATGLVWIVALNPVYLKGAAYAVLNTSTSDSLIAVALFILMGEIIQRSDVANRFYNAVAVRLRRLPGGLLHANIAVCAVFAAVSGSSIATAATIGTAAIPNFERLRYDIRVTLGSLAAGGTLGILIPPSIPLIIYGALVEESVGRLFIAAVVPGLMMVALFEIYIFTIAWLRPSIAPPVAEADVGARTRIRSMADTLPLIAIILVVLGGMYMGWTTPTEAAALGALAALLVAGMQGTLSWEMMHEAVATTARVTSMLLFIVLGAQIFSFAVFSWGINSIVANFVGQLPYPPIAIFAVICVIYLILGMFVDALSMMVMTLAVVHPIVVHLGYDSVWFGVVLVLLLEIGLITPPVGMNLFTIQAIRPGTALADVAWGAFPFVFLLLIGIGILVAFPQLALWLPSKMF